MEQLRELLKADYRDRLHRNLKFSIRSYARFLDISTTSLTTFMSNKRGLSKINAEKILVKLGMKIEGLVGGSERKPTFHELDLKVLEIAGDWYFFAILSLMETKDYRHDYKWIANRLGIDSATSKKALSILEEHQLIARDSSGQFAPTQRQFKTPDQMVSFANRKSHIQALDLARHSLEEDDISRRSFTAMTIATTPEKLLAARPRIARFRQQITKFLESGAKTEVYRVSIQIFPLSKRNK